MLVFEWEHIYKGKRQNLFKWQDRLIYCIHPRKERFQENIFVVAHKD